jgi:hypothetical protein
VELRGTRILQFLHQCRNASAKHGVVNSDELLRWKL